LLARPEQENSILLVLPADHYIEDRQGLAHTVTQGARFARQGQLVTFGVVPQAPETGYGYIRKGEAIDGGQASESMPPVWRIDQFVEKPALETAKSYLASGDYCWNSGMFMFRADRLLEEMQTHAPDILSACRSAIAKAETDLDFCRLDRAAFEACPADSIDYAVMEKTDSGVMVALESPWNDLGSWEALWQAGRKDSDGNVVHGDACLQDVRNSFVYTTGRLVTAVGLTDHVVVETKDAVFVAPRHHVQQVKALVERLKSGNRPETYTHKMVYRPWGSYESVDVAERFQVKRITVKPKAILSSQKHFHRAEHWIVVRGTARVTRGDDVFILKEDESTYIPLGTVHRLENPGRIPLELIEVQSGTYLGEDDIERFDDVYGRHKG
jgi:mannose-1-phosphate guanylyltransferase/mannose-6-phosphate isomerase